MVYSTCILTWTTSIGNKCPDTTDRQPAYVAQKRHYYSDATMTFTCQLAAQWSPTRLGVSLVPRLWVVVHWNPDSPRFGVVTERTSSYFSLPKNEILITSSLVSGRFDIVSRSQHFHTTCRKVRLGVWLFETNN